MKEAATIIVVDDEDAGRFVKGQLLRRAGYTVIEAATGMDALTLVGRERPDLLMLDVNLPDISGLEVSRRLRLAGPVMPSLQILQISNTAVTPSDQVQGLEHGADVYLTEPVDATVLMATVRSLLRVRRAEVALAAALENERNARQIAEEANRAKDDFIATLSHELRTPLNALMGWIWQLRHSSLSAAAKERALDSLERNARMQAQLINDLLDVSRNSKGKLQIELRLVDLQDVVAAATDATRELALQRHVQLESQTESVTVVGDPGRLQQIVNNLLTNALQFTEADGHVRVAVKQHEDDAVLTVQDSGAGIDPALLPHIFDPFRQGEGVLSRRHGGLGLGLAVVRQLVDLHGGSIEAASGGLGSGSTFTIRIPVERAAEADPMPKGSLLLDGLRVVVTANEEEAAALAAALESAGATVQTDPFSADVDMAVRQSPGFGPIAFRAAGSAPEAPWHTLEKRGPAAAIVREIARTMLRARPG